MDDEPVLPPTVVRFVPDRRYTGVSAVGLLVALGVLAFDGDDGGRLLAGIAVLIFAVSMGADLLFAPRLEASALGLVIRSPFVRRSLSWPEVETVRVVERPRLGLRNRALEVDAGEVLAEFTSRTLGADVDEAAALIDAVRPR